jgi:hypothetical protein
VRKHQGHANLHHTLNRRSFTLDGCRENHLSATETTKPRGRRRSPGRTWIHAALVGTTRFLIDLRIGPRTLEMAVAGVVVVARLVSLGSPSRFAGPTHAGHGDGPHRSSLDRSGVCTLPGACQPVPTCDLVGTPRKPTNQRPKPPKTPNSFANIVSHYLRLASWPTATARTNCPSFGVCWRGRRPPCPLCRPSNRRRIPATAARTAVSPRCDWGIETGRPSLASLVAATYRRLPLEGT